MRLATRHASTINAGLPEPVPQARCVLRDSQSRMFLMFASGLSVWARVVNCDVRSIRQNGSKKSKEILRKKKKKTPKKSLPCDRAKTHRSTNVR